MSQNTTSAYTFGNEVLVDHRYYDFGINKFDMEPKMYCGFHTNGGHEIINVELIIEDATGKDTKVTRFVKMFNDYWVIYTVFKTEDGPNVFQNPASGLSSNEATKLLGEYLKPYKDFSQILEEADLHM